MNKRKLVLICSKDNRNRIQEMMPNEVTNALYEWPNDKHKLQSALLSADIVLDFVEGNSETKKMLLETMGEAIQEHTVVATDVTLSSVSDYYKYFGNPGMICGIRTVLYECSESVVELIRGLKTIDNSLDFAAEFFKSISVEYVVINDMPGFVQDRVLFSLILEAVRIVEEGISTAECVDKVAVYGMGLKTGPLMMADEIGIDHVKHQIEHMFNAYKHNRFRPSVMLNNMVRAGELGKKTGKGFYHYS